MLLSSNIFHPETYTPLGWFFVIFNVLLFIFLFLGFSKRRYEIFYQNGVPTLLIRYYFWYLFPFISKTFMGIHDATIAYDDENSSGNITLHFNNRKSKKLSNVPFNIGDETGEKTLNDIKHLLKKPSKDILIYDSHKTASIIMPLLFPTIVMSFVYPGLMALVGEENLYNTAMINSAKPTTVEKASNQVNSQSNVAYDNQPTLEQKQKEWNDNITKNLSELPNNIPKPKNMEIVGDQVKFDKNTQQWRVIYEAKEDTVENNLEFLRNAFEKQEWQVSETTIPQTTFLASDIVSNKTRRFHIKKHTTDNTGMVELNYIKYQDGKERTMLIMLVPIH